MKPVILVKLKMRKIYKTFLTIVGLLIMLMSSVGVLYLVDGKNRTFDSDIEVTGALSINYIDGKMFDVNETKTIKFTVSNGSDDVGYYNIGFRKVRGNGTYKIFHGDVVIIDGELSSVDEITTDYISIDSKETKIYTLEIVNTGVTPLKGILNIRNQNGKTVTFSDTILKNSPASDNTLTKVGSEAATEDEGLIKSSDDIGVSYYFRGNVQNNYVEFGNLLWRIVRINGDGTVRLVLNTSAETLGNYYTSESSNIEFEKSAMNNYLDSWLNDNLKDEIKYIANAKYCSDVSKDNANNYLAYTRIMTNNIPTLNCLGTTVSSNIGLLTIDEAVLAGASTSGINQKFYLYNSDINDAWYTMSAAKNIYNNTNMFMIGENGNIRTEINGNLYRKVRPVINLIKNVEVTGDGTINNPYKIVK